MLIELLGIYTNRNWLTIGITQIYIHDSARIVPRYSLSRNSVITRCVGLIFSMINLWKRSKKKSTQYHNNSNIRQEVVLYDFLYKFPQSFLMILRRMFWKIFLQIHQIFVGIQRKIPRCCSSWFFQEISISFYFFIQNSYKAIRIKVPMTKKLQKKSNF